MIMRKITSYGDWIFGKGISSYVRDESAIEENIKTRVLEWKNDCFFALQNGIDYQSLLDKGQQENLSSAVKSVILSSYGVMKLKQVLASLDSTRKLTVQYTIDTIFSSNFTSQFTQ